MRGEKMINQVIRASAGTGKTYTLLKTIFNYKEGTDTPDISYQDACQKINDSVFVTFSNSAAAEIRSRIYKGLRECKGTRILDLTQALAQQEVRLRVYTIHAFALEMLRLFRYKLCLPAELSFAEEDPSLWDLCVREFFAKNWNQKALQKLFQIKPEDKTVQALLEVFFMLSDRKSLQKFIEQKGNTLYFLAAMGKSSAFNLSADANLAQAQELLQKMGIDVNADYREALLQAHKVLVDLKEMKANKGKQDPLEEQRLKDILFFQIAPVLDMGSYFVEQIVLEIGQNLYMPQMLKSGVFDFDAVVFLFVKELLRGDKNFLNDLQAEGQSFRNLYVDEAQDNDIIQNYLIALLGKKDYDVNVYVVGDLKQSIYTWRDAYPREFEQIIRECAEYEGGRLLKNLDISYRLQAQNTCEAINNVCTALSNKYGNHWWYTPDTDNLKLPQKVLNTSKGQLEMWWADKPGVLLNQVAKKASNQESAADFVNQETTMEKDPWVQKLDSFFAAGKTAVVVRSRNQLTKVPDLQQKLQALKANYKIEKGIGESDELAKINTLQPELELIILLFMALTEEQVEQVPFALFWAEAGKLISQQLSFKLEGALSAELKCIFEKIYKDIIGGVGNRVECVLNLFDTYNLWNYLCHKETQETPQEVRRIFYHILMRAQLAEDRYNRRRAHVLGADPVWTILRKGKMPRSCYRIPKEAAPSLSENPAQKTKSAPDVLTIHGSKGLTYDNMIVVADFQEDFFGNTENFSSFGGYLEPYSQLFSADFVKILGDEPQLNISYFPYLGSLPAEYVRTNGDNFSDSFWKKLKQNYQSTEKLIRSEKLNLLYVALTRTAKNLLLLDVGAHKPKKEKKKETDTDSETEKDFCCSLFEKAGFSVYQVKTPNEEKTQDKKKEQAVPHTEEPSAVTYMYYEDASFRPMDIKSSMQTHSVRSEIAGKIYRNYGKRLTCLERFEHAKKGSMAHAVIQRLLGRSATAADFAKQAQALRQHVATDNGLYAQAVQLVSANEQTLQAADLFGKNYTFFHEVPLWRFNEDSKTLTKGSVDTLAVGEQEAVIVEYKVLFGDAHNQQTQAQEQMDRYKQILLELEQGYPVKTRAVELRE